MERAHLRALQKSIREPPLTADKLPIDEVRRAAAAPQERSLRWDKCERRFRVDTGSWPAAARGGPRLLDAAWLPGAGIG